MSNPTSNFGWQMPTPVDLVTDLPADFEVFGQAVDSSLADLKGGTTGQILSKATNTDMDFVWIANDQGDITGITATSPLTGGGTSGAVTVGIQSATTSQSGAVQLSDSTSTTSSVLAATPTAVKSAYDLANKPNPSNPILNSAAQCWQRGTSISISASNLAYTADRWQGITVANGAVTVSRQGTGDTTNLPNIQYALRWQRNSGQTGTGLQGIFYSQESINSIPFAGKAVTLSFYGRCGANYSATSNILAVNLETGTGTDENIVTANSFGGYTGKAVPVGGNATLTTTWQRFTFTGTLAATITEFGLKFFMNSTGTAGANDWFEITGVQLDVGSVALPFRTYAVTIQGELAAAQRYYYRQTSGEAYAVFGDGLAGTTTTARILVTLPVTMRVKAASLEASTIALYDGQTITPITSAVVGEANFQTFNVVATVAAGLTQYRPYQILANNSTSAYIGVTAEL